VGLLTSISFKVEQSFQDLNLIYCELTSLLALASSTRTTTNSPTNPGKSRQAHTTRDSEGILPLQTERVSEYVIQLLRGEALSGSQVGRLLTPAGYTALLPTIWSLLNQPLVDKHPTYSNVLQAMLEHATKTSSNSVVKKLGIEFVARLVLVSLPALILTLRSGINFSRSSLKPNSNIKATSE
jgi:pre-rRNA-processing protein IPI1